MAKYKFQGSPDAIAAASQAHAATANANAMANAAAHQAHGQKMAAAYNAPAGFANAYANTYGAQAGALGNLATAVANERSNMYGANAMAEAARMGALGNIGSAGLGAYGSAANASMDAWARNQQAYNQSLASMQMANQNTLGALGTGQYQALGRLGGAYGVMGLAGGGEGGTFSADGRGGPIAEGSFSGAGGGGGGGTAGMDSIASYLMSPGMAGLAQTANTDAMNRLDGQHMSSRDMPSQMLGQSLSGLMTLTDMNSRNIGAGMDQFYGNQQQAGNQAMSALDRVRGQVSSGASNASKQIGSMWDGSLGQTVFQSPEARRQQQLKDRIAQLQMQAARPGSNWRVKAELSALQGLA